jgi:hypothetical protein
MNIFVLNSAPGAAATDQCDKHVVKMPLETAQILCSVLHRYAVPDVPYRLTHANHPCTLWAGESRANFLWLYKHGIALGGEYTHRYGKTHKSVAVIKHCYKFIDAVPAGPLTAFVQAMPEAYRNAGNPVQAYREYYLHEKARIATWNKTRNAPLWWQRGEA